MGDFEESKIYNVLRELVNETKKTNESLQNVVANTKDTLKELTWYKSRDDKVDVYIHSSFVSVGDIDTIKQEFQCEFYLQLRWTEPELVGRNEADEIDWEKLWDPNIYFVDAVSFDAYEKRQYMKAAKKEDGLPEVVQYFHIKGTFKELLEVSNFPYDYQGLTLHLTTHWNHKEIQLHEDPLRIDNIRTWNFTAKQQWELAEHVLVENKTTNIEHGASSNIFPLYDIRLHVMRHYVFYLYNVALIMCLITALTFSSFAVKVDSIGDRIQITLTLLLTSVAFKYYVQQFVPTVSYLTLMDKYILSCMIFQFAIAAVHNATTGLIADQGKLLLYFEWGCFALGITAFALIHIIFATISIRCVRRNNKQKKENIRAYDKKKGMRCPNDDQLLDNIR